MKKTACEHGVTNLGKLKRRRGDTVGQRQKERMIFNFHVEGQTPTTMRSPQYLVLVWIFIGCADNTILQPLLVRHHVNQYWNEYV